MANEGQSDLISFPGGALVADMLAESTAEQALELSQYALEDGAVINDHAVMQPRKMTLTLVQTESPISAVAGFAQTTQEISYLVRKPGSQTNELTVRKKEFRPTSLLALTSAAREALFSSGPIRARGLKSDTPVELRPLSVTVLAANADVGRVNEFHSALVGLLESVELVTVTVKQRTYPAMVLTSVSRQDSAGQFGAARFTVQLQQVSTAETRIVELPPVPQATGKVDRGKKDAQAPAPAKETEVRSTLDVLGVGALNAFGAGITP